MVMTAVECAICNNSSLCNFKTSQNPCKMGLCNIQVYDGADGKIRSNNY